MLKLSSCANIKVLTFNLWLYPMAPANALDGRLNTLADRTRLCALYDLCEAKIPSSLKFSLPYRPGMVPCTLHFHHIIHWSLFTYCTILCLAYHFVLAAQCPLCSCNWLLKTEYAFSHHVTERSGTIITSATWWITDSPQSLVTENIEVPLWTLPASTGSNIQENPTAGHSLTPQKVVN